MRRPKLLLVNPRNRVSLYGDYLWEPLSLGYVAAVVPDAWDVELLDEQHEGEVDYASVETDLVGITAFTTQATRAYAVAAQLRARGIPVVMGGIHASLVTDEALDHVDAVVTGEAEEVFPAVLHDLAAGRLSRVYAGARPELGARTVRPRREIFRKYRYEYVSAQTSRGCPMDCSFCSVTAFNGNVFRMRQVEDVVDELRQLAARDVILVDDDLNGFSLKARNRCLALFDALEAAALPTRFVTQVTINFGDDDEMPRRARAAGCAGVFIGLESTDRASLDLVRKDGKSRRRGLDYYRENVARIRGAGIGVIGSFILGIDTQDMGTIVDDILGFAEAAELDGLNPTILTPLPGTRDYAAFRDAGRILFTSYPADWERYTLAFPVTSHPRVSGAGLMRRYLQLLQFFRPENVARVHDRTRRQVSGDAAWHAWLWNRAWTNYGLRRGLFGRGAAAAALPREMPREPPEPPGIDAAPSRVVA